MNLIEWKSFRVKQGMRSSHGEVVAVTVGRTEMLTILAHCSVEQGKARWELRCAVHKMISHTVHSSALRAVGTQGGGCPPLGQMQRFLPNVSTCH